MAVEIITKEDLQIFRLQLLEDLKQIMTLSQSSSEKKWLRSSEVRKLLKISNGTLQTLRISGKLRPSKIGGIYYYSVEEVNTMLENNGER